jgi:hypothetical protein
MSQSQPQGAHGEPAESGVTTVAFAQLEIARLSRALDAFMQQRRPPPHIRPELDLGFRISGQSVEIFKIRPRWQGSPREKHESPVAKATYVKARGICRVFWQRSDLKWHRYEPRAEVKSVEEFVLLVSEDAHSCFFG